MLFSFFVYLMNKDECCWNSISRLTKKFGSCCWTCCDGLQQWPVPRMTDETIIVYSFVFSFSPPSPSPASSRTQKLHLERWVPCHRVSVERRWSTSRARPRDSETRKKCGDKRNEKPQSGKRRHTSFAYSPWMNAVGVLWWIGAGSATQDTFRVNMKSI